MQACLFFLVGDSLPKRRKGWIKKRGYYEPSAPRISSRGSPVPPTRLFELFSRYRGALEVGGVLSLLGWALPHKAPPSGHKRPLATHMRGAVLAFPDQDRSHTCSVRDWPTQLCIDRKAGRHSPQGSGYVQYVPPSSRHAMVPPGGVGAGRVRIAAEQQPRPDLIYLLGNSSGDFTVAKEAPRSIKHFR